MDKAAIKNFATTARNKLISAVKQRAFELGITENEVVEPTVYEDGFSINGEIFRNEEIEQREHLVHKLRNTSFDEVIEEVAYTWFNRFIAIRFMEVNDYLPTGIRLLSSMEEGKTEPDALTEVNFLIDELNLNRDYVYELEDSHDNNRLFKYIIIKQCNQLGAMMPLVFEEITGYTALLLPDYLLTENSVLTDLVEMITEENWQDVEIVGWLYQYYNANVKEEVGGLRNRNVPKEHLPVVTQLFTPKWIVQYMTENSLGKIYDLNHPNNTLTSGWEFYLKSELQNQEENINIKLENIKVVDPACGSGHILVYAFDLLFDMYQEQGYVQREIPRLILQNNLFGIDIDKRSIQIATIALWLKALQKDSRFYRKAESLQFNLLEITDTDTTLSEDAINFFVTSKEEKKDIIAIQKCFENGKQFGSLIRPPGVPYDIMLNKIDEQLNNFINLDLYEQSLILELEEKLKPLLLAGKYLLEQYEIVITNPPYHNKYNNELRTFIRNNYKDTHRDLFTAFITRTTEMTRKNGYTALMTPFTWMFISSHQKLREHILNNLTISSLVQLEYSAFEEATVPICTFVLQKQRNQTVGEYVRLADFKGADVQPIKVKEAVQNRNVDFRYSADSQSFMDIPGSPIAYWASDSILKAFKNNPSISDVGDSKKGLDTSNNSKFLRLWHEVNIEKMHKKWFPLNKGGSFRKWYGNQEYLIDWKFDGKELKKLKSSNIRNERFYFEEGISWTDLTSGDFSARYFPTGFIFDASGPCYFGNNITNMIAYMNSNVFNKMAKFIMPTMHYTNGSVAKMPYQKYEVNSSIVKQNISLSKSDWDAFETSWDFKKHPFLQYQNNATTIEDAFNNWAAHAERRFYTLKENEEKLNKIFIDLYGLQDEITPNVDEKDVTVRKADQERDVKSFLSYLVGIMFGRYSLEEDGLVYAGGEFDSTRYKSFTPDQENIIPITDKQYFEDDIVARVIELTKLIFGETHLENNLAFIADTLTRRRNETSRERIRRYFLREFYRDHVQIYQKRPIYWQMDSGGRNDAFRALIYVHRYKPDLLSRVRTAYLHPQMRKYEEEMNRLQMTIESDVSQGEKTRAKKEKDKIEKQVIDCQNYDQVLAHMAHQLIDIDLDDGVKENYEIFQAIEIPQGEGERQKKANIFRNL